MDTSADLFDKIQDFMENFSYVRDEAVPIWPKCYENTSDNLSAILSHITPEDMDYLAELSLTTKADNWMMAALFSGIAMLFNRVMKPFPLFRREDWHLAHTAIDAARRSFTQVLEHLSLPGAHLDFKMNEPTKSLCTRVLSCFLQFLEKLSIENSSCVPHYTAIITEAAEIAKDVMNICVDYMPEDGLDIDDRIPEWLKRGLGANIYTRMPPENLEVQNDDLVGLSSDVKKIKEQLLNETEHLDVIPITGMGGIGKTTLALRIYEDSEIIRHFHVCAWTPVSQNNQKREALVRLLEAIAPVSDEEISKRSYEELGELLCRRLKGRKYLIALDDIWTTSDWDEIRQWLPDDKNCSRIVLTSRLTEVGTYANPRNPPHCMKFLGFEDSWILFCKKVFLKQTCPPELVNHGLKIVEKCRGLPLAIVVVAGHLSKISLTPECWEDIAKGVNSLVDGTQEQFSDIFSLSYNGLPQNIKACFLYMGIFPKNSEIPVQKLVRLWTALGFLRAEMSNSLEEMGEKFLEDLISRNLISVRRKTVDGRVKTCGIHDLLSDLCLTKAQQEGEYIFCHSPFSYSYFGARYDKQHLLSLTRTFFYFYHNFESDFRLKDMHFSMLRVLDIFFQPLYHFPDEITQLVNLRYLALATCSNIPSTISQLSNLETLINYHMSAGPILPKEIWQLLHLRHLHIGTCTYLPNPSSAIGLPHLQTLSTISSASCTKEVCLKLSNLKQLAIYEIGEECKGEELLLNCVSNLVWLSQLQKLKLRWSVKLDKPRHFPHWKSCMTNIKNLTLVGSQLQWEEMDNLAMLPYLEVLKLKKHAFRGIVWEQNEIFHQLKFLLLQSLELKKWKADKDHFPSLQRLDIRDCYRLLQVPDDFGEMLNLQSINLDEYNLFTAYSARKIQMYQIDLGNDHFKVQTGRVPIEARFMCLVLVFIHMTLILKKRWYQYTNSRG